MAPRTFALLLIALTFFVGPSALAQDLRGSNKNAQVPPAPIGTVLPVRLEHQLSSRSARIGQGIAGRLMQDVPLPGGRKIREGTRIRGTVVAITAGAADVEVHLRFDKLESHGRTTAIVTGLRALASPLEVASAQTPEMSPGFGTPYVWATTRLVGGGEKYGVGGPVTDEWSNTVGEGTFSGVLAHLPASEAGGCRGEFDEGDRLQALWVFSANACGVYGVEGLKIMRAGRDEPLGEIVLATEGREIEIEERERNVAARGEVGRTDLAGIVVADKSRRKMKPGGWTQELSLT